MTARDLERIEAVHPEVARALRTLSGMERLRLAHETRELTCDRLAAYVAAKPPGRSRDQGQKDVARRLLDDPGRAAPPPR